MKIGLVGKILIVFGIIFLVYALNMSVAMPGSDVINFQMISDRQNGLIISGLLFISGIILFAVAKVKQTEEEDMLERSQHAESKEKVKRLLKNATEQGRPIFFDKVKKIWNWGQRNFVGLSQGWISIIVRVIAAIVIGEFGSMAVFNLVMSTQIDFDNAKNFQNWTALLFFAYAFRRAPVLSVLKHILITGLVLLIGVYGDLIRQGESPRVLLHFAFVGEVIALICVYIVGKVQVRRHKEKECEFEKKVAELPKE